MSSTAEKAEHRRRPVSALALKLWETAESLDERLDDPAGVLDLFVTALAKGEDTSEPWDKLHEAAVRDGKVEELAFAYEQISQDKRVRLMQLEHQAELHLRAARFFARTLGDASGAAAAAERAAAAAPGHPEVFALLEELLAGPEGAARLARQYFEASARARTPEDKFAALRRASELLLGDESAGELAIEVGFALLALDPAAERVRQDVIQRLIARGRHKDVVDLLDAALKREPPPDTEEATLLREQAMDICLGVVRDPERALAHVEGLLALDASHAYARKLAEELVENRQLGLRAAAALSTAYERTGEIDRAVAMLGFELKQVRGPRRVEVQRKLGILRQDLLGDPAGALELLGPVVAGDPGDDDLRRRFVELSLELDQSAQAARLLSRALTTSRDQAVRARVAVDVGEVYLTSGDPRRAQAAFQQVLEINADESANRRASSRLADLYSESKEPQLLAQALELVVRLEPDVEARRSAARRLARLTDGDAKDPVRAITAWRALIGSESNGEALDRLEVLCREVGDEEGLADVLVQRAEALGDPAEAKALLFKAATMRSERPRDRPKAINAWLELAERYGHSREIDEKLLPLLEAEGRFPEVVALLERRAASGAAEERDAVLLKLAELRLTRLGDQKGALGAFAEILKRRPSDAASRAALERLLSGGEVRLDAADVLEPVYRAEGSAAGLIKVLEARAELATGSAVFAALGEALSIAENQLQSPEQALEISGWGLERAVSLGGPVSEWLAHVNRLGNSSSQWRAVFLADALGSRNADTPELFELAQEAGAALSAAGDLSRALELYRRALAYAPSSRELIAKVDELLAQQGAPEERLGLYGAALQNEREPQRRKQLLHTMATLQDRELGDRAAAIATLRAAVEEDPRDLVAHEALLAMFEEAGDSAALHGELARALPHVDGERRKVVLLRLGEVATAGGDGPAALQHYRELLTLSDLSDDVLDTIEHLARECNDGVVARLAIERRLAHAPDQSLRGALLERLGNVLAWMLGDTARAAEVWLEGARLSEIDDEDPERARKLYERVLDADPSSREAAERLVDLLAQAGDWARLEEVFGLLLGLAGERDVVMLLFGLEERAASSGRLDAFVRMLDAAVARVGKARARHLLLAKARALGATPAGADQSVALYRSLLEEAGDDASADAEAFGAFLRTVEPSPARVGDFRWLYEWRVQRSANPADVLAEWAAIEEKRLGNVLGAAELYGRIVEMEPERVDALSELARLELALGRSDRAYQALESLKARAEGDAKYAASLKLAGLLVHPLGRPAEALEAVAPVLEANPGDLEALRIVHQTLEAPECRARAAEILEKIAGVSDDRVAGPEVIEALLLVSAEAPELARARTRWLTQLLKTKTDKPRDAHNLALQGAEAAPEEGELWDVAIEMARRLNDPQPVAEALERAMKRDLGPEVADALGRRMVEFLEEWFDDPERVMKLLERVLALNPQAIWAFDRLKLAFNSGGRWNELFSLYDRRLAVGLEKAEAVDLLREAAMAAKDFAADAERAIRYLEQLNEVSPGDGRVESSLERLYERHGRTRPLIDLLSRRLESAKKGDKSELTARIAALWLDLSEPAPAFALASELLSQKASREAGAALLERILPMPAAATAPAAEGESVLESTAKLLERHYRGKKSTVDVVRMLEIEVRCSNDSARKISLLDEVVGLRLEVLGDTEGAFETMAELLSLSPTPESRERFAKLSDQIGAHDRRADTLEVVAATAKEPALRAALLLEAGTVRDRALRESDRAAKLLREVVALREHHAEAALVAGRRLAEMLRENQADSELVGLLEVLGALEPELDARRRALGEAAERALNALGDAGRAVRDYRARLALDEEDREAVDGLCRALERAERWDELVIALEGRAKLAGDQAPNARADRVRIARIRADAQHDPKAAIEAWRRVQSVHGPDQESFEALASLFHNSSLYQDLAGLLADEVLREMDPKRECELLKSLGEVQETRLALPLEAVESYAAADDWTAAVRVGATRREAALDVRVIERLLELSVKAWTGGDGGELAPQTADWSVAELAQRLLEGERVPEVVAHLLKSAELPFAPPRRRELRRSAAYLACDRLGDGDQAITLFQSLLAEDPADEVAASVVARLAALLEERSRHGELTDLWETQAAAHAGAEPLRAAELWTRAARLAENELEDRERALAAYKNGALLDSQESLEALARLYQAEGDTKSAAEALERLCALSGPDTIAARALGLSDVYLLSGQKSRARDSLERAVPLAADAAALRKRLRELYRDARDYTALAGVLAEEAALAGDPGEKLGFLREAATLHVVQRKDPTSAVPLLELASALDPDDAKLRVDLALALHACERHTDAAAVLRQQLERYGQRRPKDRAQVHYELARVLLAIGSEPEALAELELASKIDPAHPGITQLLADVAFRQGELDRAERMYRALLLTAGKSDTGPGRTDALVALAEIARRRGDQPRADEFIESAFESALENAREAGQLEQALRSAGRQRDLMRLLEARSADELEPEEAARVTGELVMLYRDAGELEAKAPALHDRARKTLGRLESAESLDDGAWAALGRAFDALGDGAGSASVLEQRVTIGGRSSRPPADPELFYRLAEARLADPATLGQGIDLLERAVELELDVPRARSLIELVTSQPKPDPRVATLSERLARAAGDAPALARALALRAAGPEATLELVREGLELSRDLADSPLAMELVRAALDNPKLALGPAERGELRSELAALKEAAGDVGAAFDLYEEAAAELEPAEAKALFIGTAERASSLGDDERAARLFAKVLDDDAVEPRALGPLLELLKKLGKRKEWLARAEHAIQISQDAESRAALRLEQARVLLEGRGGDKKAIEVLEELLLDRPGHGEATVLLAELLEKAGRHDDLARLLGAEFDAAVDAGDAASVAAVGLRLVETLERGGRPEDATEMARRALHQAPESRELAERLLRLAEAAGERAAVAEALERLLPLARGAEAAEIARRLAAVYEELGDEAGVERALELACVANPEDGDLLEALISRFEARGESSRAAELLARALEARPDDTALLRRLAVARAQAGEQELAAETLDRLVAAQPNDAALRVERARLYVELGREDAALVDYDAAYTLEPNVGPEFVQALERAVARAEPPDDLRLALRLVDVLEASGDLDGARARLAEFLTHKPDDLAGFRRLASLDQRLGNEEEALVTLERVAALETGSGLVEVALALADAAKAAGRAEIARPALERALEVEPEHPELTARLEALYLAVGAARELGEMLLQQAALIEDASRRQVVVLRAAEALLSDGGDRETALRVLEVARGEAPASLEVASLLAKAYSADGQDEKALEVLKTAAAAQRGKRGRPVSAIFEQIAAMHLEEGFLSDALEALTKAFEADNKNAELALTLGRLAIDIDELEIAQRVFRAVTIMRPKGPDGGARPEDKAEASYHLAVLAKKQGDPRKARVLVSKALADDPDHAGARAFLGELDAK